MLYLDASAFAKLFLEEEGSALVRELWASDAPVVTSWLSFAETRAAIAAARRSRRLSRALAARALRRFDEEWDHVTALIADELVARVAGTLVVRHRLRGVDGFHLASALPLRPARAVFVTFDLRLARAARTEGFAVAGEQ
jgi:predicted nucleic acid-binding protein